MLCAFRYGAARCKQPSDNVRVSWEMTRSMIVREGDRGALEVKNSSSRKLIALATKDGAASISTFGSNLFACAER